MSMIFLFLVDNMFNLLSGVPLRRILPSGPCPDFENGEEGFQNQTLLLF